MGRRERRLMFMYVVFFRLQTLVPNHNLVIASYDIVRNDIDFFRYILTLHIRGITYQHFFVQVSN